MSDQRPSTPHLVALEEENLEEGFPRASFVEELDELELHLVKHRELFLSRQIETFKIDMVRYVYVWMCTDSKGQRTACERPGGWLV